MIKMYTTKLEQSLYARVSTWKYMDRYLKQLFIYIYIRFKLAQIFLITFHNQLTLTKFERYFPMSSKMTSGLQTVG